MDHSRRTFAFTLIELLVVVAIIAVLIAILLPALNNARAQGKSSVCKAQLNQIGKGLQYYADEYSDYFPARVLYGYNAIGLWYDNLGAGLAHCSPPVLSSRDKNYICPANEWIWGENVGDPCTNYAVTHALSEAFRKQGNPYWGKCFRYSEFVDPCAKVQVADGCIHWVIPATDVYNGGSPTAWQNFVGAVHLGGTNALYGDGHADWSNYYEFVDLRYIRKFFPDW